MSGQSTLTVIMPIILLTVQLNGDNFILVKGGLYAFLGHDRTELSPRPWIQSRPGYFFDQNTASANETARPSRRALASVPDRDGEENHEIED
jgi:hypothetical protein